MFSFFSKKKKTKTRVWRNRRQRRWKAESRCELPPTKKIKLTSFWRANNISWLFWEGGFQCEQIWKEGPKEKKILKNEWPKETVLKFWRQMWSFVNKEKKSQGLEEATRVVKCSERSVLDVSDLKNRGKKTYQGLKDKQWKSTVLKGWS